MILAEKEATERWCAFARVITWHSNDGNGSLASTNRIEDGTADIACHCIASRCMAWRWVKHTYSAGDRGYCGLAGKAEIE